MMSADGAVRGNYRSNNYNSNYNNDTDNDRPRILWSCVARGDKDASSSAATILAEAGDDEYGGLVKQAAIELLRRKATPGFEFHTTKRNKQTVKGVKFHVYEPYTSASTKKILLYVYCAVYEPELERKQVQSFLEKIVCITEPLKEMDHETWRTGGTLSLQSTFAPILLQRMEEVEYLGKLAMIEEELDRSKEQMQQNIELLLSRGEQLEALQEHTTHLQDMALVFKKNAKRVRRMKMWQDAKHGLILGGAITAGIAVVTVPPLIALL